MWNISEISLTNFVLIIVIVLLISFNVRQSAVPYVWHRNILRFGYAFSQLTPHLLDLLRTGGQISAVIYHPRSFLLVHVGTGVTVYNKNVMRGLLIQPRMRLYIESWVMHWCAVKCDSSFSRRLFLISAKPLHSMFDLQLWWSRITEGYRRLHSKSFGCCTCVDF